MKSRSGSRLAFIEANVAIEPAVDIVGCGAGVQEEYSVWIVFFQSAKRLVIATIREAVMVFRTPASCRVFAVETIRLKGAVQCARSSAGMPDHKYLSAIARILGFNLVMKPVPETYCVVFETVDINH